MMPAVGSCRASYLFLLQRKIEKGHFFLRYSQNKKLDKIIEYMNKKTYELYIQNFHIKMECILFFQYF